MAKTLIAFFSRADENYFGGAMRYIEVGNTEVVAGIMKDLTGADNPPLAHSDGICGYPGKQECRSHQGQSEYSGFRTDRR